MRILIITGWIFLAMFGWLFLLLETLRIAIRLNLEILRTVARSMGEDVFLFGVVGLSTLTVMVSVALLGLYGRLPGTRKKGSKRQPAGFAVLPASQEKPVE